MYSGGSNHGGACNVMFPKKDLEAVSSCYGCLLRWAAEERNHCTRTVFEEHRSLHGVVGVKAIDA